MFEDNLQITPTARLGTVQHVTERPSFGIAVNEAPSGPEPVEDLPLESLFGHGDQEDGLSKRPRNANGGNHIICIGVILQIAI